MPCRRGFSNVTKGLLITWFHPHLRLWQVLTHQRVMGLFA